MHVKSSLNNQKLGAKYGAFRNLNNNKNTQFQQNYMSMNIHVRFNNQQCRKALFISIILQLNSIKISQ